MADKLDVLVGGKSSSTAFSRVPGWWAGGYLQKINCWLAGWLPQLVGWLVVGWRCLSATQVEQPSSSLRQRDRNAKLRLIKGNRQNLGVVFLSSAIFTSGGMELLYSNSRRIRVCLLLANPLFIRDFEDTRRKPTILGAQKRRASYLSPLFFRSRPSASRPMAMAHLPGRHLNGAHLGQTLPLTERERDSCIYINPPTPVERESASWSSFGVSYQSRKLLGLIFLACCAGCPKPWIFQWFWVFRARNLRFA